MLVFILLLPGGLAGQEVSTCGWHYLDETDQPASITAIMSSKPPSPAVLEAADQLMKWYRQCDATAARVAAQTLRRERSRSNSRDPQLLGLLGIALLRGPEVQVERAAGYLLRVAFQESNAATEGMRLLSDVASRSVSTAIAEEMAAVALAIGKKSHLETALETLSARTYISDGSLSALRAELLDALGQTDSAQALVAGKTHPRHRRMSAVLAVHSPAAQNAYFTALADASQADLPIFFDDIRLILTPNELEEWSAVAPVDRAAWLLQRWEWRAMMAGTTVMERLAEHHRRVRVAKEKYLRKSPRGVPPTNAAWLDKPAGNNPFDDRGLILLRHGDPLKVISYRETPIAWYYGGVGPGPGVFEFSKERSGYVLIEPSPACKGGHVLTKEKATGFSTVPDPIAWAMELLPYDKHLAHYYQACGRDSYTAAGAYLAERTQSRAANRTIIATETAGPRFAQPIEGTANLYGFWTVESAELIAYIGIPLLSIAPEPNSGGRNFGLALRLAAGDASAHRIVRVDSVLRFALPTRPAPGSLAGIPLRVLSSAGTNQQVVITVTNLNDTTQGQVISGIRTLPANLDGLGMSDIVIAQDRDGVFRRGGHSLSPVIGHSVEEGDRTRLYYELYGFEEETPVDVHVQITPSRDESILAAIANWVRRRAAVSLSFQDRLELDENGAAALLHEVPIDLGPGKYVLNIRVTDRTSGKSVQAETSITVRNRGS